MILKDSKITIRISATKKKAFKRYAKLKQQRQTDIVEAYLDRCIAEIETKKHLAK